MAGEEQEWYYVDSTGQEFGPFPSSTMRGWFQQGFFPMQGDLLVRLSYWTDHQKLSTLYSEPIMDTAFATPPSQAPKAKPSPKKQSGGGGKGGGGKSKQGGRGQRGGGGCGDGSMGPGDLNLSQQMSMTAFGGGLPGMGLMPGAGFTPYGFPAMQSPYAGMSPFGAMPAMSPFGGMGGMPPVAVPGQRFHGRIKSFNAQKGFGFIECAEAHAIYGRDVFLHKAQISDFSTGSELTFCVDVNKSGMPQARDLMPVDQFSLAVSGMGMGGLSPFGVGAMGMGGKGAFGGGGKGANGKGKGGKAKGKPKGKAKPKQSNPEEPP
jgi:cold shock CspA family protein